MIHQHRARWASLGMISLLWMFGAFITPLWAQESALDTKDTKEREAVTTEEGAQTETETEESLSLWANISPEMFMQNMKELRYLMFEDVWKSLESRENRGAVSSYLSFDLERRSDEVASEFLTTATAFNSGYLRRGFVDGYLGLYLRAYADISLEAREAPFALELEQAYLGVMLSQLKTKVGFIRSSVYQSEIWSYQRALPSVSLSLDRKGYTVEMLYSFLPYIKKDRPQVSSQFPYVVSLALHKKLERKPLRFLKSYSVMWTASEDISTELADQYFQKGNSVRRGRFVSDMEYSMSTLGLSWTLDAKIATLSRLTSRMEVMRNMKAPKGRAVGLWGDVYYSQEMTATQSSECFVGYRGYSVGSDVFLAEFSDKVLDYTGTNGHGPSVGCAFSSLRIEGGYWMIEPREKTIYKRSTRALVVSVSNKIF